MRKIIISGIVFFIFGASFLQAQDKQKSSGLPRSTPEGQGVSSDGIINFLNGVKESGLEFHSFMILRHGKVISEGWWNPYGPDLKHTLYSTTKSFTSSAIGFAVSEGRLNVTDKVISFFAGDLPDTISPYLAQLNIQDLLTMTIGQDPEPNIVTEDNWIKTSLSIPIVHRPGSKFLYNNDGPFLLSAIVQKVTGQKLIDYLTPRLFEPLSIEGQDWEINPQGINPGGWGLRLKTEDMAKFGQLYLQKGVWNGRQLLSKEWIDNATTMKIDQYPIWISPKTNKDSSDWSQGYCYLFWRCRNNAYRADGAMGQSIIVIPDQDAVIAITAGLSDMQTEINLVWKYILPAIRKNKLPEDIQKLMDLKSKLSLLTLPIPSKTAEPSVCKNISGKVFSVEQNIKHIEKIAFHFNDDICRLILTIDTSEYKLNFGSGKWEFGETTKHGPYLLSGAKDNLTGLPPFKVAGAYRWADDNTLELTLRYIESPHNEKIICHFNHSDILVDFLSNIDNFQKKTIIIGREQD